MNERREEELVGGLKEYLNQRIPTPSVVKEQRNGKVGWKKGVVLSGVAQRKNKRKRRKGSDNNKDGGEAQSGIMIARQPTLPASFVGGGRPPFESFP